MDTARTYLGTPFQHQARLKGVGIDCLGLVVQVGKELYDGKFHDHETGNYSREPDPIQFVKHVRIAFKEKRVTDYLPGDIVLFFITKRRVPRHVGIIGTRESNNLVRPTLIHTHAKETHGVVEITMDKFWERRITHCFEYPEVEG